MPHLHIRSRLPENPVVVVTGASSGIGRATAHAFAGAGARLVLAARSEPPLQELAQECAALGGEAVAVPTDVTDAEAVLQLAEREPVLVLVHGLVVSSSYLVPTAERLCPEPTERAPEAEWGFEPALLDDLRRIARERRYRGSSACASPSRRRSARWWPTSTARSTAVVACRATGWSCRRSS
jgi:hypothetical protein